MAGAKIPEDWDGISWKCWCVQWPDSRDWLAILAGFITTPRLGRYWDADTGTITEVQQTGDEIWFKNTPLEEVIMSCSDDVANALLQIAASLQNMASGGCGCIPGVSGGSSGSGMVPDVPSDTIDTAEAHEGDPPPGYASWEEFDDLKCRWGHKIMDDMITDVATMTLIDIGAATISGLAIILVPLLVNPVSWTVILGIATLMVSAAATSGFYGFMSTHLEAYYDNYLCALLAGDNVDDSISNFAERVDANMEADGNFNSLTGYWAGGILKGLASIDSVNRMYEKQALTPPEAECDCSEELMLATCTFGTITNHELANMDIVAEAVDTNWLAAYGFDGIQTFDLSIVSGSVTTPDGSSIIEFISDGDATICGAGGGNPAWAELNTSITINELTTPKTYQIFSGTPFTLRVHVQGE